jgi:hypothetical protein
MSGIRAPWYVQSTTSVTVYCPWSGHDVTARYLVCGDRPVSLIGCSETGCAMSCLAEGLPPGVSVGSGDGEGEAPISSRR